MERLYIIMLVAILFISLTVCGPVKPNSMHDNNHVCSHKYPTVDDIPHHVHLEHKHHVLKRNADKNLRIKVFYDKSVENLPRKKKNVVKRKVVPNGVGYWEDVLMVRQNHATIKMNRKCAGNQYFLIDDEGHDGGNKSKEHGGHVTQYCKDKCVTTKCGEFTIPTDHLAPCHTCNSKGWDCKLKTEGGKGIDGYDFILYVTAINTRQCGDTIGGNEAATVAYAAHCQQEKSLDRPIAGHTNICPASITDGEKEIAMLTSTIKHELLHALGFSLSLFAFYHDKDGNPMTPRMDDGKPKINKKLQVRQWSSNTIKQVTRPWNVYSGTIPRDFNLLVTPKVKEEVRNHFGCNELEGAELEDQGGDGTSLTHWEKRLFQNEAMTGTVHTQYPVYSRLTFALMEDTGWYIPDYSKAQNITWGRNMGCDFAMKSCKEMMEKDEKMKKAVSTELFNLHKSPFCTTLQDGQGMTLCNHDRTTVGSCNLVQYERSLPKIYQNFASVENVNRRDIRKVGSSVALGDYCPYVQEFSWKASDGTSRGTKCTNSKNQPNNKGENLNYGLETYGKTSTCVEQGKVWDQESCEIIKQWHRYGAGCYDYRCKDGKVNIIVGKGSRKEELVCDKAGQNISVALKEGEFLHMGAIICPGCIEMCGEENCFLDTNLNDREGRKEDGENTKTEILEEEILKKLKSKNDTSSLNSNRTSKSISRKEIPDSKVGVKDELECGDVGGGGFFNQFFDYFDD